MAALTLSGIEKIYNPGTRRAVSAVKALDMDVAAGEIIGLLGSSGCGKTSTLRMIAGLESISAGEARIGDTLINELPPARRNVAMAFEGYALYPPLKVRDNIGFSLLRDKIPRAEVEQKIAEVAALLQIEDILDRYPPTLSGGQQQRVSLARALIRKADLHLLDEPMSQLEPQLRARLRVRIKDYLNRSRMTTVFVTHDQTEAIALADRIAVMENGELMQFDTPDGLRDRPANLFVASFIGEPPMNLLDGVIVHDGAGSSDSVPALRVDAGRGVFDLTLANFPLSAAARAALAAGRRVSVGIRPQRLRLLGVGSDTDVASGAAPRLRGSVVSNQWLGDQTHVGVDVGGVTLIAVSGGDDAGATPLDSDVELALPADALHVFDGDDARGTALLHGLTDET